MWSHICVILVLWSQVNVNHCICNVVNTHFTWSVYFCVYIYHAPPYGPCTPPDRWAQMSAQASIMCLGDNVLRVIIHHARQSCSKNSDLLNVNNCYAISCRRHSIVISISCEKHSTLTSRCTIYYPYRVGWLVKPSNIGQWNLPRAYTWVLHTDFAILDCCSGAWNGRGRGSHMRTKSQTYTIFYTFLVIKYISPLVRDIRFSHRNWI